MHHGVWKLNFEKRIFLDDDSTGSNYEVKAYFPIQNSTSPYLGSYSSIINSTSIDTTEPDLYKYMRNLPNSKLKTTYYTALGRERWGQYSVNNDQEILNLIE